MKILVPSDGSVCAQRALDYAIHLAQSVGNTASISLLSVHDDAGLKHVRKHFPKGTIEDFLHDLSAKGAEVEGAESWAAKGAELWATKGAVVEVAESWAAKGADLWAAKGP